MGIIDWTREQGLMIGKIITLYPTLAAAPRNQRLLDVGSGDGKLSRMMARMLSASFLYMVDPHDAPASGLTCCPEQYWRLSIASPSVTMLRGQVDTITAISAVHEFERPEQAVKNMLSLFKKQGDGMLLVSDMAKGYWTPATLAALSKGGREHAERDLARVERNRLLELADIRTFWFDQLRAAGLSEPDIKFSAGGSSYLFALPGDGKGWDAPLELGRLHPLRLLLPIMQCWEDRAGAQAG